VAILDINEALLEKLALKPNILTLNCDAREISCLEKVKDYDLFVVLTDSDETNLTVAGLIKALNPQARTVVKISRRDYKLFDELLKLQTVDIVDKTAEALCGLVDYPFAQSLWNLGDILIFRKKVALDSVFHNRKLKDLKPLQKLKLKECNLIIAVEREGKTFIPKGSTLIRKGDYLYCLRIN
jgi:trk system potassium uptake protein TrkA